MESILSESSTGFSSSLMLRSSCHTLCTWMASFMCEFSHVPSSGHIYFGHLKSFSPVWVLSCFSKLHAWENVYLQLKHALEKCFFCVGPHTLNIWKASLLCGSSNVSLSYLLVRMFSYTWRIRMASVLCGSPHASLSGLIWKPLVTLQTFKRLVWVPHASSRNLDHVAFCALEWLLSCVGSLIRHTPSRHIIVSHFVHLNGFSPVWSHVSPSNLMFRRCHSLCTCKYGISPEWILSSVFK